MTSHYPRREFIGQTGAALAAFAVLQSARHARAFPGVSGEKVVPWLDQPGPHPKPFVVQNQLTWEELDS